jgi:hypothetical protein
VLHQLGCVVARTFLKKCPVLGDPFLIFGGNLIIGINRIYRALGSTGAAIDAGVGIDEIGGPALVYGAWDNAFDGANLGARAIADA